MKVLEPVLAAPSWANTSPGRSSWPRASPSSGSAGLRSHAQRRRSPEPGHRHARGVARRLPDTHGGSQGRAQRGMAEACPDPAAIPDLMQMNYRLFDAPVVVYLCMDRCLTPWSMFDLGALSQSIMLSPRNRVSARRSPSPGGPSGHHPQGTCHSGPSRRRHRHRPGIPDPDSPQNRFRSTRRSAARSCDGWVLNGRQLDGGPASRVSEPDGGGPQAAVKEAGRHSTDRRRAMGGACMVRTTMAAAALLCALLVAAGEAGAVGPGTTLTCQRRQGKCGSRERALRKSFACKDCHPGLFSMKHGTARDDHGIPQRGRYCGVCHNGTAAFSTGTRRSATSATGRPQARQAKGA